MITRYLIVGLVGLAMGYAVKKNPKLAVDVIFERLEQLLSERQEAWQ